MEVRNLTLFVNDSEFRVRGVTFSPVPVGWRSGMGWIHVPETYEGDLPMIRAMGANTLRMVSATQNATDGERFLDAVSANGLHVIWGVPGPMRQDASDPAVRQATLDEVRRVVTMWKHHPAILMWSIGNEVNYLYGGANVSDWYSLLEEAARLAKSLDPNHPVVTANSGLKDADLFRALAPSVDVFGVNHYNFAPYEWPDHFLPRARKVVPEKPLLVMEFGVDAWDSNRSVEDEATQARMLVEQLRALEADDHAIGALVYEWVDEWWKSGAQWEHDGGADWEPYGANRTLPDGALSEEWFGLVAQRAGSYEREPRAAYFALKREWAGADLAP